MTLRWRFGAALALFAAIAVTAVAVVAYVMTAGRLSAEVDSSLQAAAANFLGAGAPATAPAPAPVAPAPPTGQPLRSVSSLPPSRPRPAAPPPGLLNLVVDQHLASNGSILGYTGGVVLPVTSAMRRLARDGGPTFLTTLVADGDPYRIIVVALAGRGAVELGRDIVDNDQLLSSLRWRFGLVDLLGILLAGLLGAFQASRMARPIEQLTTAVENVTTSGAFHSPIEVQRRDEIGRLAKSFAEMLRALTRSREQQQRLVEDAGHELRTPLTSLRTNIDLMRRHHDLPADVTERILGDLNLELSGLTRLANELVELATERRDEEPVTDVELDRLAGRVAERAGNRASHRLEVDAEPVSIRAQHGAVERAINNLVDNAMKFSPPGSIITVVVRDRYLEVTDNGVGIPESDLSLVFDRFYRSAEARSQEGSGLGLAIVRDVAERLGGVAYARNEQGGGATVGFTFEPGPPQS